MNKNKEKLINWKDKLVNLINKISTKKGWKCNDINPFFEQIDYLGSTDAQTLKQFKQQIKTKTESEK